jgi:hypothetical protein
MKPRARRVTIAAAVLGAGVVGVLVVLNWATVRDHFEGWRFQLTRKTETIDPDPLLITSLAADMSDIIEMDAISCFRILSTYSGLRVIVEPAPSPEPMVAIATNVFKDPSMATVLEKTADATRQALQTVGYRILEQRFPRRAYVVIRDETRAGATR